MIKIKEGFILREVADTYAVVAVGKASMNFKGMITLNETGAFLWKYLALGITKEDLLTKLLDEYEVSKEDAIKHIDLFINKLKESDILE